MKKILIVHSDLNIGGAETSLLGLLNAIDYSKYEVDLFLLNHTGELMKLIPKQVNLLPEEQEYKELCIPIKDLAKKCHFGIAVTRIKARLKTRRLLKKNPELDATYIQKQILHGSVLPYLRDHNKAYDIGISFNDPHYILPYKFRVKKKLFWFHTDFSTIQVLQEPDLKMWNLADYIVTVSDGCQRAFIQKYPQLQKKVIVMENILSDEFICQRAQEVISDMKESAQYKLLSVGRFCEAKNFDSIPEMCSILLTKGLDVIWYLIGFGGDEQRIRDEIKKWNMEKKVLILGKKENPYPYMKACDVYVQPSRFEGKCVSVREAQLLHKTVLITAYATSKSQLHDGDDGVILPMDTRQCAEKMAEVLQNKELRSKISSHTQNYDYTNKQEIKLLDTIITENQ